MVARLVLEDQPEPTEGPRQPHPRDMAAIVAATEVMWPRPTVEEDVGQTADAVWKFANRWWHGGSVLQRGRPRRPSSF